MEPLFPPLKIQGLRLKNCMFDAPTRINMFDGDACNVRSYGNAIRDAAYPVSQR